MTLEKVRYHHTDSSGYKRVSYPVKVKCLATRDVVIHQERWEDDNKWTDRKDDKQGESNLKARVKAGTTVRWEQVYRMPDTPHDGNEELYHKAWFTVRTVETYPVTSPRSVWLQTPYTSIPN